MNALAQILDNRIVAIIRGAQPDDVLRIADALYEGGIRALEVTLNSPNALQVIQMLAAKLEDKVLVGAGTVLDAVNAATAISAGARFIVSPNVDADTIRTTRQRGAVSIPGAFTASEIIQAYHKGGEIIKVFPASVGPEYIKDLRGPLSHIPMMPTGGVRLENIAAFKKAGAVAFGIGSALVDTKQAVTEAYLEDLKAKAKQFVAAVK